jgi:hypothetical protein
MPNQYPGSVRSVLGYRSAFWILVLASVLPLWLARCLPCVDLPQHLDFVNVLRNVANPYSDYARTYSISLYPSHNVLHLLFVYLASFPFGIELANKLFFSIYVAGFALSLDYLLRALGANRWLGLLGILFVYNFNFFWGFPGMLATFPLLMLVLALEFEWLKGEGQSLVRWALLASVWILAFLAHALGFALILLLFCLVLLMLQAKPRAPGRIGILLATLVPALALFVIPWLLTVDAGVQRNVLSLIIDSYHKSPPITRLQYLGTRVGSHDALSLVVAALVPVAIILRLIVAVRRGGLRVLRSRSLAVTSGLALTCFACYLFLPERFGEITVLSDRFAAFGCVLLTVLLAVTPELAGLTSRAIAPIVLAVLLFNAANVTWRFSAFDRVARPGLRLVAGLPANKTLLGLVYADRGLKLFGYRTLLHFANYYPVYVGGYAGFTFAEIPFSPVRFVGTWRFLQPGQEWFPWAYVFPDRWRDYDFLLVRGTPRPTDSVYINRCSLRASDHGWRLYTVLCGAETTAETRVAGQIQGQAGAARRDLCGRP